MSVPVNPDPPPLSDEDALDEAFEPQQPDDDWE
jgi:hypothetical protein